MKRVILFLLFLLTALSMICALAEDAEPVRYTSGGYVYTLQEDGTAQLNLYRGPSVEDLLLPSVLDGYAVTSVYAVGFNGIVAENMSGIISVTIPDSIVSIGEDAFEGCNEELRFIVGRDSAAAVWCRQQGIVNYTYPDANDWLFD